MANTIQVDTVNLKASNGKQIRKVTRVTIGGESVTFTEKLGKREAIRQALDLLCKGRTQ